MFPNRFALANKSSNNTMIKDDLKQLANFLLQDSLQQQTAQELFNSLSRLEKGARAIKDIALAAEALEHVGETTKLDEEDGQ